MHEEKKGDSETGRKTTSFPWLKALGPSLILLFLKFIWQSIKWPERQALIYFQTNLADQNKFFNNNKYVTSNSKCKWELNAANRHNLYMLIFLSQNRTFFFLLVLLCAPAEITYDFFAWNSFLYSFCFSFEATSEFRQS